jgi:hypothetical protein
MAKNTNNNSKTTKTVEPINKTPAKNDNSKKKATTSTTPSVTTKLSKNKKEITLTIEPVVAGPLNAPVTFSIDKKNSGSGSGQAGKKRGSYTQNLWALEFRDGNKFVPEAEQVYLTRDEARDALIDTRRGYYGNVKRGDVRLAKYTLSRVDHA